MNKIKEALDEFHGLEFYETTNIKRTRTSKSCDVCYQTIPKGSHHIGFRFYGEDCDWPVFKVCDECAEKEKENLHLIKEHKRR